MTISGPRAQVPSDVEAASIADLAADAADVRRHLAEVPAQRRVVRIPEPAVAAVAGLDEYGD